METITLPMEDEIQKYKSALKEKEKKLHDVKKKLEETERELETFNFIYLCTKPTGMGCFR